jgi:hypothetical protein
LVAGAGLWAHNAGGGIDQIAAEDGIAKADRASGCRGAIDGGHGCNGGAGEDELADRVVGSCAGKAVVGGISTAQGWANALNAGVRACLE